jgi:phage-related minor tail protein
VDEVNNTLSNLQTEITQTEEQAKKTLSAFAAATTTGLFNPAAAAAFGERFGNLPAFQRGGVATRPTAGIFGEAGPEALVPLDRFGEMGGKTIINNITVNQEGIFTGRPDQLRELAQELTPFIEKEQAR